MLDSDFLSDLGRGGVSLRLSLATAYNGGSFAVGGWAVGRWECVLVPNTGTTGGGGVAAAGSVRSGGGTRLCAFICSGVPI